MKILVVAPTPFFSDRGTHIRILEEALALEKRGHEVTIATYHIGQDLPERLGSHIDIRRIRRLLFWYKKLEAGPDWQKIILDLLLIKKVLFLARTKHPDIIHGHLHEGALIAWIVQKMLFWRDIKVVADFHGSLTKEMVSHQYLGASSLKKVFRFLEHQIDNMGDVAVASSWNNTEEIRTIRKKGSVEVLLDGTRLSMFDGLPTKESIRAEYGVPQEAVVVTYTGAFIKNKGIQFFLGALPEIARKYPQAHFVLAGFPLELIVQDIAVEGLQNRLTVISPSPYFDLGQILKMSDIGVDPKEEATREASGKALQYMGASLPVVCFDTQNNREYLGEGGIYAKEATVASFTQALERAITDVALREHCGMLNHKRAQDFSWERGAQQLENLYTMILKK
ncbi:MAG: glycosyltransferase family 4 protein [Candidatus Moranbacteria bacterium]|nr:glycosyltransferase family 4 protein [Candidatus Moranbacteria bacterium]